MRPPPPHNYLNEIFPQMQQIDMNEFVGHFKDLLTYMPAIMTTWKETFGPIQMPKNGILASIFNPNGALGPEDEGYCNCNKSKKNVHFP